MSSQKEFTPKGKSNEEVITPKKSDQKPSSSDKKKYFNLDEGSPDHKSDKKTHDSSPRRVEKFSHGFKDRSLRHDRNPSDFNYLKNKRGHDYERSFMNNGSRSLFHHSREFKSRDRSRNDFSSRSRVADYRNIKQEVGFQEFKNPSKRGEFLCSSNQDKPHFPKGKGWICKNYACDGTNFLSRDSCFKCGRRIPNTPLYRELPQYVAETIINSKPRAEFKIPFNPITGPNFKIIPTTETIESPYSHTEITRAIDLISKVKSGKGEKELLELIKNFN